MKILIQTKADKIIGVYDNVRQALAYDQDEDFYITEFIGLKTCKRCKREKLDNEFYDVKENIDGKQGHCKECQSIINKKNKEKYKKL